MIKLNTLLNVRKQIINPLDLCEIVRGRLTKKTVLDVAKLLDLSGKELVSLLPTSERTMQRIRLQGLVSPEVSEHTVHLAKIAIEGQEIFSTAQEFKEWLVAPSKGLDGRTPINVMDSIIGCNLVLDMLGRAKHGVYA